jgi:hypothetical protein
MPANHLHGPYRTIPPPYSLYHQHGPSPDSRRLPSHTAAHIYHASRTDQPSPAAYTIYVDGGWDTIYSDFTTDFQEQRNLTNRSGSAGITIVPTSPDWMNKGTIRITLNDGSQVGSQPAHMELAAIIISLALRRWQLPLPPTGGHHLL